MRHRDQHDLRDRALGLVQGLLVDGVVVLELVQGGQAPGHLGVVPAAVRVGRELVLRDLDLVVQDHALARDARGRVVRVVGHVLGAVQRDLDLDPVRAGVGGEDPVAPVEVARAALHVRAVRQQDREQDLAGLARHRHHVAGVVGPEVELGEHPELLLVQRAAVVDEEVGVPADVGLLARAHEPELLDRVEARELLVLGSAAERRELDLEEAVLEDPQALGQVEREALGVPVELGAHGLGPPGVDVVRPDPREGAREQPVVVDGARLERALQIPGANDVCGVLHTQSVL